MNHLSTTLSAIPVSTVTVTGNNDNPGAGLLSHRFRPVEHQEKSECYWGVMHALGQLGASCSAYRVCFHDGVAHDFHSHPRQSEIVIVTKGSIEQFIESERRILNAGDSAVIPLGARHKAIPQITGTEVIVVLLGDVAGYESCEMSQNLL